MIIQTAKDNSGRVDVSVDELETMRLALLVLRDQYRDVIDECKAYGMKGDHRDQQIIDYHAEHADRAEQMARIVGQAIGQAGRDKNRKGARNV